MAVALTATLVSGCSGQEPALESGPLERPRVHAWSIEREPGAVVTDGFEILSLTGKSSAVIEGVELINPKGMELLGAKLAGPTRGMGSLQTIDSWPPVDPELDPESVVPAVGTTITPRTEDPAGWELLLGIRVTAEEYATREAIRVTYTVDGVRYAQVLPAALAICTSEKALARNGDCPFPGE